MLIGIAVGIFAFFFLHKTDRGDLFSRYLFIRYLTSILLGIMGIILIGPQVGRALPQTYEWQETRSPIPMKDVNGSDATFFLIEERVQGTKNRVSYTYKDSASGMQTFQSPPNVVFVYNKVDFAPSSLEISKRVFANKLSYLIGFPTLESQYEFYIAPGTFRKNFVPS